MLNIGIKSWPGSELVGGAIEPTLVTAVFEDFAGTNLRRFWIKDE
jgi:hypothetical protein